MVLLKIHVLRTILKFSNFKHALTNTIYNIFEKKYIVEFDIVMATTRDVSQITRGP